MANSLANYRAVADCNVIIAAHRSAHALSPNREFIERWRQGEFELLYSVDTLAEYAEKLLELGVPRDVAVSFLAHVVALGEGVEIHFFHLPRYSRDADDIAFLLCAWNGLATHLVSYDDDLLILADDYRSHFSICRPFSFLIAIRGRRGPTS